MKKYFATIDNKNLLEDGFEDDLFRDFYPATDHRKGNVRHLIGMVEVKEDKIPICDAFVDVKWHFGDAAITITMLGCNPFCDEKEVQFDELCKFYESKFKEMEDASNENCMEDESFHIGIERKENQLEVSFWWEVDE